MGEVLGDVVFCVVASLDEGKSVGWLIGMVGTVVWWCSYVGWRVD
jgi:hypothetical protein